MSDKRHPCLNCKKTEAHSATCHIGCEEYALAVKLNEERKEKIKQARFEDHGLGIIWNDSKRYEVRKSMRMKRGGR